MHQSDNDSCSSNSPAIAPRNGHAHSRILSNSVATLLGVIALGTAAAQAELWTYTGSANDWTIGWTDGVAGDPAPPGVDGGSYTNIRLEIAGVVTYGPEQGNQTYDISAAGGETRALVIGNSGSGHLTITGGTLTLVQEGNNTSAIISNNDFEGALTLAGGNLVINETDTNGDTTIAVTWGQGNGSTRGTLTVGNGSTLTADRISFGQLHPDDSKGEGYLYLNSGGTLEIRSIRENSSNELSKVHLNFDGGTIKVRGNETGDHALLDALKGSGDTATIHGGGLTIDTNSFTARITQPLAGGTGNGGLVKTGEGTLIIQTDGSTYTGDTVVEGGTLVLQANNTTYGGNFVVNAGRLQLGNNSSTGSLGDAQFTIASGASLAIRRSDEIVQSTFTGSGITAGYSGNGNLEHLGSGLLILDVANTHRGTTVIANNSHLRITHANALGTTDGGTVVNGSGGDGDSDGSGGSLELVGGETGLTITGETLTIRGSGGQSLTGGAQQRGALQAVSGAVEWAGTVNIAGTNTRIGIQDGAHLTLSGTVTDNGAGYRLIFRGGGSTASPDNVGTITIAGSNHSWVETALYGSTLRIASDNVLPVGALLSVGTSGIGGSIFDLNGYNQEVAGLSQTANNNLGVITNKGASESVLTINNSASRTYLGQIVENGGRISLIKKGSFDQTLTNANSYTGDTIIQQGRLIVNGSLAGSEVTVEGGSLSGGGTITPGDGKDVTLLAGGKLEPGDGNARTLNLAFSGGGKLDISTGVAATASQALVFELGAPGNSDSIAITGGALHIGNGVLGFDDFVFTPVTGFSEGTYTLFSGDTSIVGTPDLSNLTGHIGDYSATLGIDGSNVVLTVVPEPGSAMVILAGAAVLAGFRRRRRNA